MTLASPDEDRFIEIASDGAATSLALPFTGLPDRMLLATNRAGALGGTADETVYDGFNNTYPGGVAFISTSNGTTFTHEDVADRLDGYIPPIDFDFAPDGTPYVFYDTFPNVKVATRPAGGGA